MLRHDLEPAMPVNRSRRSSRGSLSERAPAIARRTLRLNCDGGERSVVVTIFMPEPHGDDYICRFLIDGINCTSVPGAKGVDPIQAIILALTIIGAALYTSAEYTNGRLRWLDDSDDLGFPRP